MLAQPPGRQRVRARQGQQNAVEPGFTATYLNGNSGHQTIEEGTDAIVALAATGPEGPTGTFSGRTGRLPW